MKEQRKKLRKRCVEKKRDILKEHSTRKKAEENVEYSMKNR